MAGKDEHNAAKRKPNKVLRIIIAIVVVCFAIGVVEFILHPDKYLDNSEDPANTSEVIATTEWPTVEPTATPEPTEKPVEVDGFGWTEKDYLLFETAAKLTSDEYIDDYKAPWSLDDWKFVKFDDTGKIIVSTEYKLDGNDDPETMLFIFTLGEDSDANGEPDTFTPHFLSVGSKIYLNDGACSEVFEKWNELLS